MEGWCAAIWVPNGAQGAPNPPYVSHMEGWGALSGAAAKWARRTKPSICKSYGGLVRYLELQRGKAHQPSICGGWCAIFANPRVGHQPSICWKKSYGGLAALSGCYRRYHTLRYQQVIMLEMFLTNKIFCKKNLLFKKFFIYFSIKHG